uniref:Uncharacterized protein n=1 Tax=Arundo donax TaxID=35708 RepID=A0A0A8ZQ77_ARUDO
MTYSFSHPIQSANLFPGIWWQKELLHHLSVTEICFLY